MESVHEVFKVSGQPTVTYVTRQHGHYEKLLSGALDRKGTLCLLTGPSKTGKTTLYTEVAKKKGCEVLPVRCDKDLSATEFWRRALEQVNFDRIGATQRTSSRERRAEATVGGNLGWCWLASMTGATGLGIARSDNEAAIREKILSSPSPDHLVPILKHTPFLLVVEDFHYLKRSTQQTVFQQWKTFVDNEVSVLVVGTTHHVADLAYANKDLIGRFSIIDLTSWTKEDLKQIPQKGFECLGVKCPQAIIDSLAKESAGLPIIAQSVCLTLMLAQKNADSFKRWGDCRLSPPDLFNALHDVAVNQYGGLRPMHERLSRGPRKKARRYNTYELVLSSFALDPITFALDREDIEQRLRSLPVPSDQVPPSASVNSMLSALESFQRKLPLQLLEWSETDNRLYIVEPTFLFYLRWHKKRTAAPAVTDWVRELFNGFLSRNS